MSTQYIIESIMKLPFLTSLFDVPVDAGLMSDISYNLPLAFSRTFGPIFLVNKQLMLVNILLLLHGHYFLLN